MELRGSSAPARTSAGHTLCLPPNPTHSEPDESSSTVPALMLMAMGMTPLSCSWRLWRGGGRGGGPFRLPSLAVEAREDPVPCSRGSLRRLLFSLMVGRHFFLRMPGDKEVGTLGCGWEALGHPREAQQEAESEAAGRDSLTFVGLGRRAWKGSQRPFPRQGIPILAWPLFQGPATTAFLCCSPKVSWPRDLPGPWTHLCQRKEAFESQRGQAARTATTPALFSKKP